MERKRKLNYKRVFIALIGCCMLIGIASYLINSKAQAVKSMDNKYSDVEMKMLLKDSTYGGYSVSYPFFEMNIIDETLKNYVTERISQYEKELSGKNSSQKETSELSITYDIVHYSKQTVTIVFEEYKQIDKRDGYIDLQTFNFDIPLQKSLSLEDVFKENSDYLSILSTISYAQLKKNQDIAASMHTLKDGTKPIKENFRHFSILEDTIVLYFRPNQVAPDHLGVQTIAIKKNVFKNDLLDTYQNNKANKNKIKEIQPPNAVAELPKREMNIDPNKKVIALTFDDGPNTSTTTTILKALKKYDSHATFFVLGSRVKYYPDMITEMLEGGNEVGNHSWDHPQLTRLNKKQVTSQIEETQSIIKKVSGYEPIHMRPPYGATNKKITKYFKKMDVILWDIDSEDWKVRNKDKIVKRVMAQAEDGKVVLMHDIYQSSAEAAVEIIKRLNKQGYQLVTISELQEIQKLRKAD
ncbi:polysaccharide deacetylase family protein [Peribacillus asahii]|uniref:polysaccharide deacetylase family protein n=1 Tax=Peribacillus asahii TaxID=228899 RepID=UPI00207AB274|nr:polysaccharide deacetylase family protein [Peribacillus asahii]USK84748.1 polysaccharide deacetylase family protein [Peribacillus asahii]